MTDYIEKKVAEFKSRFRGSHSIEWYQPQVDAWIKSDLQEALLKGLELAEQEIANIKFHSDWKADPIRRVILADLDDLKKEVMEGTV